MTSRTGSLAGGLRVVRLGSLLILAGALLSLGRQLPLPELVQGLRAALGDAGIWGAIGFGLLYVASVILLVPAAVLTMAAGAIYGLWVGTALVSVASTVGAALCFLWRGISCGAGSRPGWRGVRA